jgi:hypothetical protein
VTVIPLILSGVAEDDSSTQLHVPGGFGLVDPAAGALHNNRTSHQRPLPMDLAEEIEGMYRLLELVSEHGSSGPGNEHS